MTTSGLKSWKTERRYQENSETEIVELSYDMVSGDYAETWVSYGFFETEKEAAQAFLNDIKKYPNASFSQSDFQRASQIPA